MKQETQVTIHPLAQFAATLQWSDVPAPVQRRTEDLWVDWFGSVLAGCRARPVASITRFALSQGPASGPAEVIGHGATSSPMMAALANAAASHVAEQDDVHNGSVFHPAAVVFPP
ncbi:MmgE/PrpD family protein, partial [Diaphorobacter nitroreducens]